MEVTSRGIGIDFIGPPGVGKSTLIQALEFGSNKYLSRSAIINNILRENFKKQKFSVDDLLKQLYFFISNRKYFAGVDESKLKRFYSDYFNTHRKILLSAYKKFSDQEDEDEIVKAKRIQLLLDVLKDLTLYQHFSDNDFIGLFDDSLSNMLLLSILPENISNKDFVKWSQNICLSRYTDGVVSLFADRKTIMNRLNSRKRVNTAHIGLSEKELREEIERQIRLYKQTINLFSLIDVPILELNSTQSMDILQEKTEQFIESIRIKKTLK